MAHVGALPKVNRYITTHDSSGKAVFSTAVADESKMEALPDNMAFALSYTTQGFPVDLNGDQDIKVYESFLDKPPGLTVSGGTVLRHVDFPPTNTPVMHRTVSLDFGVVIEGSVYCVLDSGEERLMKRGGELCLPEWRREHEHSFMPLQTCVSNEAPCMPGATRLTRNGAE
jgi:hypothetical protein